MKQRLLQAKPSLYLSVFRIGFGMLMIVHFVRLLTRISHYTDPNTLAFPFAGLEFLTPPPSWIMYAFWITGILAAIGIMVGFKFAVSALLTGGMYGYFFFIDKLYYNNHYYLLILICILLAFTRADARFSLRKEKVYTVPYWHYFILQFMLCIVFFYGGIAKLNGAWISGIIPEQIVMGSTGNHNPTLIGLLTWGGLLFDLAIPFLLFYKRTLWIAIAGLVLFNVSNHFLFDDISYFPLFMILAGILFLEKSERLNTRVLRKKTTNGNFEMPRRATIIVLATFFLFQILFPLRHYLIDSHVDWTGQGHFFSWRMKAYTKEVKLEYFVHNDDSGEMRYPIETGLSAYQIQRTGAFPDMVIHLGRHIGNNLRQSGETNFEIRTNYWVNMNHSESLRAIDPTVNIMTAEYSLFGKNTWILKYQPKKSF